jgi:TonB family protein
MQLPSRSTAVVTGVVYDPLGEPLEGVTLVIESAPFQLSFVVDTETDQKGRYSFEGMPSGTYTVIAPTTDFVPIQTVAVLRGQTVMHDIHMQFGTVVGDVTVCVTCSSGAAADRLPESLVAELERDREQARSHAVRGPEPPGGWDFYRPPVPDSVSVDRLEGEVVLEGRVDTTGTVKELRVISATDPRLEKAALAIGDPRWEPARVRGVPVSTDVRVTVRYVLD